MNDDKTKELSEKEYEVTQCGGTEAPFSGKYWDHKEDGTYNCVCCGEALFQSDTKYDSGSGWPSFFDASQESIEEKEDFKLGVKRTEIQCKKCGAHLGHLFPDGPQEETGLRYCVNSASLDFSSEGEK